MNAPTWWTYNQETRRLEPGQHRIYLASSWRNPEQPQLVECLRSAGHEVYDFRNPDLKRPLLSGNRGLGRGFQWSEIEPDWQEWDAIRFRDALEHPLAQDGFDSDFGAMQWADTVVLALPCGRSAHLELGWAVGTGKHTAILMADENEPELMYRMVDKLCVNIEELLEWLGPNLA